MQHAHRQVVSRIRLKANLRAHAAKIHRFALRLLDMVHQNVRTGADGTWPRMHPKSHKAGQIALKDRWHDWELHEGFIGNRILISPTPFWWKAHTRGMTIHARNRESMRWWNGPRGFGTPVFRKTVTLPRRDPRPTADQVRIAESETMRS